MTDHTNPFDDIFALSMEGWRLWAAAGTVVWLRSMRLAQGGRLAEREAHRMVSEKVEANATLGLALLPGMIAMAGPAELVSQAMAHYARPVEANRRRLGKGRR
ncbi:hypothetical protein [Aurantiacibacter spongiae]|uniref:Uncharacterized protein n=1 Tax=Aurantiacibacter spongiae TaxID=2488860 RepID=A0A3N5CX87_9SPHN|nr:hypothetical protein [Aurantiacibacter spongiae]RPF72200.1 hypothetical protein EG799_11645 [Aurantiacibacter spongiae]